MGHIPHLDQLALVIGVGVVVALLLRKLKLPTVAGLIAAGALCGPYGLKLVSQPDHIEALAEVGVVLLLFTVGLEFSLARLKYIARLVLMGGSLQVLLTIAAVVGATVALGGSVSGGVFLGFLFAMSSTAIVLRALAEHGELEAPHGRLVVGVLIFQDLCVVPMMLLVPVLAGKVSGSPVLAVLLALGKAALVAVVVLGGARLVVPRFLGWVAVSRSRELFLLSVLTVCMGIAWVTAQVSLSLALGAFLAGMVLADTAYAQRALGEMLPLRDIFASLFFMSMGMLFDWRVLIENPVSVLGLFAGLVVGKGFLATLAALAMRFPARVAWLAGVGLAQFGEFGFVLAAFGASVGLIAPDQLRELLAAGALSMFITPLLLRVAPHVSAGARLLRPLERLLGTRGIDEVSPEHRTVNHHVVIGGYGTGGRMLGRALADSGVPFLALDLDLPRLREASATGEPVYYGDVTNPEALAHARLAQARVLVLMIDDADAAQRAVAAARALAPEVSILVRSRGNAQGELLRGLGADNVVSERLEAGLEMMARVLRKVGLPGNVISDNVRQARQGTEASARRPTLPRLRLAALEEVADLKVESFLVRAGAYAIGSSVSQIDLRRLSGALVIGIRRGGALLQDPDPKLPLVEGDLLVLAGSSVAIRRACSLLEDGVLPEDKSGAVTSTGPR